VLHDSTDQVILVVCYTNHALDQFIEDLVKIGIPKLNLLRLGGKASPQMEELTLRKQPKTFKLGHLDWLLIDELKLQLSLGSGSLCDAFNAYRTFYPSRHLNGILEHIEIAHPEYYSAFQVPIEKGGDVVVGRRGKDVRATYLLDRWMSGHDAGIFKKKPHVLEGADIWKTTAADRRKIKEDWIDEMLVDVVDHLSDLAQGYNRLQRRLGQKFSEGDLSIIGSKRIIACTTTGAAKYRERIASAKPGILIVEEAGEILESHILTALSANTEQIILIGDHKLSFRCDL
jgi:hypothetical protein